MHLEKQLTGKLQLIFNLQILRGLAALGVVLYHTNFQFVPGVHTDLQGVSIFFVVSGFIMCFITRADSDRFLAKRFIRIVPMYWLFTLLMFFLHRQSPSAVNPPAMADLPRSLLFLPSEQSPVLGVGWTLNFEIYFYLVFGAALLINRRLAPLITAAFIYIIFALDRHGYGGFLAHYYAHDYIHYFIAGIALFYLWTFSSRLLQGWAVTIICCAGVLLIFVSQFTIQLWPTWLVTYYWWFPVLVVAFALFLESSGSAMKWRPLVLLGDASYSLYLSHTIVLSIAHALLQTFVPAVVDDIVVVIFEIILATVIGIAGHLYLEKPMLREIGRIFGRHQKPIPARVMG
jgi:exopolysaccharide production protein ExoZ